MGPATDRLAQRDRDALAATSPDESPAVSAVITRDAAIAAVTTEAPERYLHIRVLGEGGMGEVRLHEDTRIGREVAMKQIHPAQRHRANVRERFLREARVQGQLEHPAIVPVHDLGTRDDGSLYFTMKPVHGRTLEDVIGTLRAGDPETQRTHSRRRLLAAFGTVCLAVHFAHTRGVVHRDLKPANIMLGEFGEVYVLDWGVAKLRVGGVPDDAMDVEAGPERIATAAGAVLGTPGYIAPEQLRGEACEARADVYSLGAILFEILALERLHRGKNVAAILASTIEGTEARPSSRPHAKDVPPELDEVCARALASQPDGRFPTARALQEAVEKFLDGDRDMERRRVLAESHATEARNALGSSGPVSEASLEGRSAAMAEVGRALALDPTHEPSRQLLTELLTQPPRELPPDAAQELAARERDEQRLIGKAGGFAYLTFLLYVPIVVLMGVHDWPAFGWCAGLFVLASTVCFLFARRPPSDPRIALVSLAVASAAIGSMSTMFGPLILMPQITLMNTVVYILATRGGLRVATVVIGALGVVIPLALQWNGVLAASYAFHDGALVISPRMHAFPPAATMAFLVATSLGHMIAACVFAARFRDELTKAQVGVQLLAWQLRQLAPERHSRPSTPKVPGKEQRDRDALAETTPDEASPVSGVVMREVEVASVALEGAERYRFQRVLGEGGMGEVRLYDDARIGRDVAMKQIHPAQRHRANVQERFLREARVQGRLEHPAIVPVHDLGTLADGSLYFTMKRVHGRTLEDVLAALRAGDKETVRTYSRRRLLAAFDTVCLAVHFAHTRGVLHRDLKPANIMLGEFGEVYVLDWGVAKLQAGAEPEDPGEIATAGERIATATGAVMGTPGYIAPEHLRGEPCDGRADVYALGAILYELLSLERLHPGTNVGEVLASTLEGVDGRPSLRPQAPEVPLELDEICARALANDPNERFPTARALEEAVEKFLDGDRDLERRRVLADSHAAMARDALGPSGSVKDATLDGRSAAMAEVGRALALDPTNEPARNTLVGLITRPPREIPPAVLAELAMERRAEQRVLGIVGGLSFLTFTLYLPVILLMGVRDWSAFLWSGLLFVLTTVACLHFARRPPADPRIALIGLAIASAAIGSMGAMFGPLILMPQIALMSMVGFILATDRGYRLLTVAIGALGFVLPLALQLGGVHRSSYVFRDGALVIVPRMHGFPPGATMTFLVVSMLGHLAVACAFASRFRDALTRAQVAQHLHAWQLRQLTREKSSLAPPAR